VRNAFIRKTLDWNPARRNRNSVGVAAGHFVEQTEAVSAEAGPSHEVGDEEVVGEEVVGGEEARLEERRVEG
jgi:hypothetical protein